ncbi:MAG: cytochrome c [Terracidiphilus sp.]|nr:cytochrome c [Terracidiphilus sp.]
MLKSSLLFFLGGLVVIACLPIAGHNPQAAPSAAGLAPAQNAPAPTGKNPGKPTAESQAKAKMLYTRDCALCHGATGNGKNDMGFTMDDWTNPSTLANKLDSELFASIRSGKGDKMPPEDVGRASDTEVSNLIVYIRTLSKNQPAPAPAPVAAPAAAPAPPADAPAPAPAPAPPTN